MTTAGITQGAGRFTTGVLIIVAGAHAGDLTLATQGIGLPTPGTEEFTTIPAQRLILSTQTPALLEDTPHRAVRAGPVRAPSVATTMADRPGAFLRAEAPALAVEEASTAAVEEAPTAAVAGIDKREFVRFVAGHKNYDWRLAYAPDEAKIRQISLARSF